MVPQCDQAEDGDGDGSRAGHRRDPRRWSARWLAVGGAALVASVVGIAVAVQAGGAPACAAAALAPPVGGAAHSGQATYYDSKGAGGNCAYPTAPADHLYVALSPGEYAAAAACGGYLDVTGPRGTARVLVMDQCPECATGHIDLSREAFARIGDPVRGVVPVSYRAVVNPPLTGPLTFRMKDGASQYWFAVQVGNHGNPLRSVEAKPAGGSWRSAARQDYNYWLIGSGLGPGPYSIRVTDVYGHQAVATGIRMAPQQVQRSAVRLYGAGASAARSTASSRPAASAHPVVSPSRIASPAVAPSDSVVAEPGATAAAAPVTAVDTACG